MYGRVSRVVLRKGLPFAGALLLAACGVSEPGGAGSPAPRTAALVEVAHAPDGREEARWTVRALFPRYAGVPGERIAETLVPDLMHIEAPIGCHDASLLPPRPTAPAEGAFIELLEAGDIWVRGGSRSLRVSAHNWPPLGEVLGGAFYAADIPERVASEPRLRIEASGEEVPPLTLRVDPPPPPVLQEAVRLPAGGWALRWAPPLEGTVLLVRFDGAGGTPLSCRVPPSGHLRIPPEATPRLSARTLRVRSVEAAGYDEVWLLASSRRELDLTR